MEHFTRSISDEDEVFRPEMNGHCGHEDGQLGGERGEGKGENEGGDGGQDVEIDMDDIEALLNRCRRSTFRTRAKPMEEGMKPGVCNQISSCKYNFPSHQSL